MIQDKFFQLKQEGRTIDLFMTEIRKHTKDCAFGELKDDLMLQVLIRGLDCERMRQRLFKTDELTLERAIWKCQTMEATSADLQLWSGKKEVEVEVIAQGVTVIQKNRSTNLRSGSQRKEPVASVDNSMKGQNVRHTGKPVSSARSSTTTPIAVSQKKKHRW